jgi:hypothetical protein
MPLPGRFTEYTPPVHFKLSIGSPREMFDGEEAYTLVRLDYGHTRMTIDAISVSPVVRDADGACHHAGGR